MRIQEAETLDSLKTQGTTCVRNLVSAGLYELTGRCLKIENVA